MCKTSIKRSCLSHVHQLLYNIIYYFNTKYLVTFTLNNVIIPFTFMKSYKQKSIITLYKSDTVLWSQKKWPTIKYERLVFPDWMYPLKRAFFTRVSKHFCFGIHPEKTKPQIFHTGWGTSFVIKVLYLLLLNPFKGKRVEW